MYGIAMYSVHKIELLLWVVNVNCSLMLNFGVLNDQF